MTMRTGLVMLAAAALAWPATAQDQTKASNEKPSAKEMFLNPRQMAYGGQDEAPPAPKPKVKPRVKPAAIPSNPKPAEVVATDKDVPVPPAGAPAADPGQSAQHTEQPSAQIIRASYSNVPLGLRYTLQKKTGEGAVNIPADTEFHSGDRIQLNLEVNDTGYLYIISQGTSGTWTALFPSPEIENGDNRVQRGQVYTAPPGHVFTFSGKPGVERLFVIFSRQPVDEIDSLIYSLKGGRRAPTGAPAAERPAAAEGLMADARLDDSRIAALRAAYSRDLIIEKGDEEPAGQPQGGQPQASQPKDTSVYVVNPKGSADSRVVADIPLIHK
ncbi:MAG: DUF4384 domain-containing protein [Bryobacteraceae bacterium]